MVGTRTMHVCPIGMKTKANSAMARCASDIYAWDAGVRWCLSRPNLQKQSVKACAALLSACPSVTRDHTSPLTTSVAANIVRVHGVKERTSVFEKESSATHCCVVNQEHKRLNEKLCDPSQLNRLQKSGVEWWKTTSTLKHASRRES